MNHYHIEFQYREAGNLGTFKYMEAHVFALTKVECEVLLAKYLNKKFGLVQIRVYEIKQLINKLWMVAGRKVKQKACIDYIGTLAEDTTPLTDLLNSNKRGPCPVYDYESLLLEEIHAQIISFDTGIPVSDIMSAAKREYNAYFVRNAISKYGRNYIHQKLGAANVQKALAGVQDSMPEIESLKSYGDTMPLHACEILYWHDIQHGTQSSPRFYKSDESFFKLVDNDLAQLYKIPQFEEALNESRSLHSN